MTAPDLATTMDERPRRRPSFAQPLAQRLDDGIAVVERLLLLGSLAMMTVLVGLDVTQRTFSRPTGRTEAIVVAVAEAVAGPLSPEAHARFEGPIGVAVFYVVALAFFVGAAATRRNLAAEREGKARPGFGGSVVVGFAAFAACAVAIKALLVVFPSSVPGAQKFALGFMLWAGMLGASLATRERRHIVLDPIVKKLEGDDKKRVAFVGGLVAASFCFFVGALGVLQISGEIRDWSSGEGIGVYPSLPIPMWLATLAIPTTFLTMAFRFAKNALHDFRHGPPASVDAHSVDLNELEKQAIDATGEQVAR